MTTTNCKDCGKALTADEAHYYGATCEECEGKAFHASQDLDPAHQAEPPCPYYITGPDIAKGAYAVAEVATGRIVARIPAEQAPSLTVGDEPVDNRFSWFDFQDIGNTPAVDEAMRNLLDDQTEDNATCLIRAVVEAAGKRLEGLAAQAEPVPGAVWGMHGEQGVALVQRGTEDDRIAKAGGERLYRHAAIASKPAAQGGDERAAFQKARNDFINSTGHPWTDWEIWQARAALAQAQKEQP